MKMLSKLYNVPIIYTEYFTNKLTPVLYLDKQMFPYSNASDFISDYGVYEISVDNRRYTVMSIEEVPKYFVFILNEVI